jgi:uncharacterized membrane protein
MTTSAPSRFRLIDAIAPALTIAGMIATPLRPKGGRARRVLSSFVVSGLAATTARLTARRWGAGRTVATAASVAIGTTAIEKIGTETGRPFGHYRYSGALQPQIGGVPAIVPLAWFAMAVPARETAHAALGRRSTVMRRIVAGAATLTAWDLFLDPQMVGEGYWRWRRGGRYRGIPLTNFLGWFVTGLAVMAFLEVLLPPGDDADGPLVAEYSYMAVMETLGFAAFFRDRLVAAVGGAGMLPPAVLAVRHLMDGRSSASARLGVHPQRAAGG